MIFKILLRIFLFILKLQYPAGKSVANVRKFDKFDYKICKNESDLEFLKICWHDGVTSKFLSYKQANNKGRYCKS